MRWKTSLLSAALSGALLLGGITLMSTTAQARDRDRGCRDVSKEERELQRNIQRYGYYSRQAEHDRRELARMRADCWRNNRNNRGIWRGDGDNDRDDRRLRDLDDRWHGRDNRRWRDRDGRWHDRDNDRDRWRRDRDDWRHRDRDHDRD